MNLTDYSALNVEITEYSKVNSQFSIGRARVFYEGPNVNRTIISPEVAKELMKTIPGTPVIGKFNLEKDDFEGHEYDQIAYGFVPLEPNPMKVEITEDYYGLPVKRTYYEADVVIWDGRFPEAGKILEEEKSLSMELNPMTLEGEFEIYDDKTYLKITKAEFYGITVLGEEHTPCFKDAKFLQTYAKMLNAYESFAKKSKIGGINMELEQENIVVEDINEQEVEVNEEETTISNEEIVENVEETNTIEEETPNTDTEEGVEEVSENLDEEISNEENSEVESETSEIEDEVIETEEIEANNEEDNSEFDVKEENNELENLKALNNELTQKLEAYETAAKEELIEKFSSKIKDNDFLNEIKNNMSDYTVENLKSALGAKLADQVLEEETADEEKLNGMIYSFNGMVKKETKTGWQELVRATKAANKK